MVFTFFLYTHMRKPIKEFIFRGIDGMWRDCSSGVVLADVLAEYELLIDDRTQFARINDYERGLSIWYRANGGKITLTFWSIF